MAICFISLILIPHFFKQERLFQIDTTEIYTHLYDKEVMDAMLDHPLSQYKMANAETFCA